MPPKKSVASKKQAQPPKRGLEVDALKAYLEPKAKHPRQEGRLPLPLPLPLPLNFLLAFPSLFYFFPSVCQPPFFFSLMPTLILLIFLVLQKKKKEKQIEIDEEEEDEDATYEEAKTKVLTQERATSTGALEPFILSEENFYLVFWWKTPWLTLSPQISEWGFEVKATIAAPSLDQLRGIISLTAASLPEPYTNLFKIKFPGRVFENTATPIGNETVTGFKVQKRLGSGKNVSLTLPK